METTAQEAEPASSGGGIKGFVKRAPLRPPMMVVYGTHGAGKTTFAAGAPRPIFLCTENALTAPDLNDVPMLANNRNGVIGSLEEFEFFLNGLLRDEHPYKTLVIDSITCLETLIHKHLCERNKWSSIDEPQWMRGYLDALPIWGRIIATCAKIRDERDMGVVFIGHSKSITVKNPDAEPYNVLSLELHKDARARFLRETEATLAAVLPVVVTGQRDKKTGVIKEGRARLLQEQSVLHTRYTGVAEVKNRWGMPSQIELNWPTFAQYVPYYNQEAEESS